jgi:TrpR family transcriptional regulator, trp operon repressor
MRKRDDLVSVFLTIRDYDAMEKFFGEIFTEAERKDFSLRWELMKRLHEDVPQRRIASDLGVSFCKITRGAKILKDKKSVTSKILSRQDD